MFSSSMYLRNLRSFVRHSAGPLLGIWVLVYALERSTLEYLLRSRENVSGIWQLLVSWQANELDLLAFLTLIAVVSLTWAFRMALYRPSLLVMRGRSEQTAGDIIASAMACATEAAVDTGPIAPDRMKGATTMPCPRPQ